MLDTDLSGLDLLGAEAVAAAHPMPFARGIIAIGAGLAGAMLVPKHPFLAFLNSAALASNAHAVVKKERDWKGAVKRMGRHFVASAASLAMPRYRMIGYVAGAIAADLFIDGEGGGIIEEFAEYEGIRDKSVIDVPYEVKSDALVKVSK